MVVNALKNRPLDEGLLFQPLIKPPDSLIEGALFCKFLLRDAQVCPDGKPMHSPTIQMRLVDDTLLLKNCFRLTTLLWGKHLIRFYKEIALAAP